MKPVEAALREQMEEGEEATRDAAIAANLKGLGNGG
jgi:hypothetical protein